MTHVGFYARILYNTDADLKLEAIQRARVSQVARLSHFRHSKPLTIFF